MIQFLLPISYFIALVLLLNRYSRSQKVKELLPLFGLLLVALVMSVYQGINVALFLSMVVAFDMVAFTYGSSDGPAVAFVGVLYFLLGYFTVAMPIVAQAMLLGFLSETRWLYTKRPAKSDRRLETGRDIFQIALGLFIIPFFLFAGLKNAEFVATLLILLGYISVDLVIVAKNMKLAKKMMEYEREYTKFGQGAIFLAIGTLVVIGFMSNVAYMVVIFAAIFLADSLATIAGVNFGSPKLFYNKNKSILGLAVYFIVVSLVGYFLVGRVIFPIAFIGAIIESLPIKIDDNLSVPIILVIITQILAV